MECWLWSSDTLVTVELQHKYFDLISKDIEGFVHEWIQIKEKSVDHSMDINDCDGQEEILSQKFNEQRNLHECNAEEGCTAVFVKFENLINHIVVSKHHRVIERFSLEDTAMKMYHAKLEEVEDR